MRGIKGTISQCELVCANCHRIRTSKRARARWIIDKNEQPKGAR